MTRRHTSSARIALEHLEQRNLLAATLRATLDEDVLRIVGTPADDRVVLHYTQGRLSFEDLFIRTDEGKERRIDADLVKRIEVTTLEGNDVVHLNSEAIGGKPFKRKSILRGGAGDDVLVGGYGADVVLGETGDDELWGNGGSDKLNGGEGADELYGNQGDDVLEGNYGDDALYGADGFDVLLGGGGYDLLRGGADNDTLDAGSLGEDAEGEAGWDFNVYVWAEGGTHQEDVAQQEAPTCSFLATLAAIARDEDLAAKIVYLGDFRYSVPLYREGEGWIIQTVTFDGRTNGYDPDLVSEGKFWTVLYQRAWIRERDALGKDHAAWPSEAFQALTGSKAQVYDGDDLSAIRAAIDNGRWVVAATPWKGRISPKCIFGHAYTVLAIDGDDRITLRNPWGVDGGKETYDNPHDGLITLTWDEFSTSLDRVWVK